MAGEKNKRKPANPGWLHCLGSAVVMVKADNDPSLNHLRLESYQDVEGIKELKIMVRVRDKAGNQAPVKEWTVRLDNPDDPGRCTLLDGYGSICPVLAECLDEPLPAVDPHPGQCGDNGQSDDDVSYSSCGDDVEGATVDEVSRRAICLRYGWLSGLTEKG